MVLLWYGGTSSMMFAYMKQSFTYQMQMELLLITEKPKHIAKLKQTNILKLVNFKFVYIT